MCGSSLVIEAYFTYFIIIAKCLGNFNTPFFCIFSTFSTDVPLKSHINFPITQHNIFGSDANKILEGGWGTAYVKIVKASPTLLAQIALVVV